MKLNRKITIAEKSPFNTQYNLLQFSQFFIRHTCSISKMHFYNSRGVLNLQSRNTSATFQDLEERKLSEEWNISEELNFVTPVVRLGIIYSI